MARMSENTQVVMKLSHKTTMTEQEELHSRTPPPGGTTLQALTSGDGCSKVEDDFLVSLELLGGGEVLALS